MGFCLIIFIVYFALPIRKLGSSYNVLYFDDFLLTEAQIVVHSKLILKPEESFSCLDEIESRNCCNLTAI